MKESDLYLPLKKFLETQSYEVKGEIMDCDVMGLRGEEEPLIVELKLSLNLSVLLQAVERQAISSKVYIGVPHNCSALKKRKKQILKLLRMLGLGLLLINPKIKTGSVNVLLDPGEYKPRKNKIRREYLLGEFLRRVGDPNLGGSDKRRGVMTAYRQRALAIAAYLEKSGAGKASDLAKALTEPKARAILYDNVYGWFDRKTRGIYDLSSKGRKEILLWK
ncbi:MAG: DUF2161 family putative PD-(D/E)XK-type phosphodiesterase [Chthoniobacterales bacterium]